MLKHKSELLSMEEIFQSKHCCKYETVALNENKSITRSPIGSIQASHVIESEFVNFPKCCCELDSEMPKPAKCLITAITLDKK